ncbi:hypothetical protein Trihar35433_1581 [Trichoderma harzianum]|nr:hypothetical protein Trihar35433_1581 [Trichoderma harzianum]
MGAVVSCFEAIFRTIGSVIMAIISGIGNMLTAVIQGIVAFFGIIISLSATSIFYSGICYYDISASDTNEDASAHPVPEQPVIMPTNAEVSLGGSLAPIITPRKRAKLTPAAARAQKKIENKNKGRPKKAKAGSSVPVGNFEK